MTPQQVTLVQASFAKVLPIAGTAATLFYARLFETAPDVRRLFPDDLTEQKKKLMAMLSIVVSGLTRLDSVIPMVRGLGERHAGYGIHVGHFAPVGAALLWTLRQGLGEEFTPAVEDAWTTAYDVLSRTMIEAMVEKAARMAA